MNINFLGYLSTTVEEAPTTIKMINLLLVFYGIYAFLTYNSIHYLLRIIAITILLTSLSSNYRWSKKAKEKLEENGKVRAEIFFSGLILLSVPFFFFNFISSMIELGSYSRYNLGIASIYSLFLTSIYLILLAVIVERKVKVTKNYLLYDYKEESISIYKSMDQWKEEKKEETGKFKN